MGESTLSAPIDVRNIGWIRTRHFLRDPARCGLGVVSADCLKSLWLLPAHRRDSSLCCYFPEALLPLCDALERRPHHLQCDRESKRPSHRETHQKNCRDHGPHPTARPKSVLSFGSVPSSIRSSPNHAQRARQFSDRQPSKCRLPLPRRHQGWHLYLVAEVLLSLRKQELFVAVALCFPLPASVSTCQAAAWRVHLKNNI